MDKTKNKYKIACLYGLVYTFRDLYVWLSLIIAD